MNNSVLAGANVSWATSDTDVITVSNGKITAVGAGFATVTATVGEKSATCAVYVSAAYTLVEEITLDRTSLSLTQGTAFSLTATVTPTNATNQTLFWASSDSAVVTVENGVVVAVSEGTATVTVISADGASATCAVTVTDPRTVVENGLCGNAVSYVLYDDGELLIRGSSSMDSFTQGNAPWKAHLSEIKKVTVLNGVTSIGYYAFAGCENLETVVLPESVKTIGRYAFAGAVSLVSADLPDTVTELGSHAFFGCSSLTNAVIPVGVTRLAPSVFEDCTSLETVVLHDGIKTIGESAFEGCTLLTNINVPITAAVKDYAFDGCVKLDSQKN